MWQHTSRIRPEGHEARNEFRVDPIGLGACALARGEGLDLGGRQLPGRNPSSVKGGPQTPHTAPSATSAKAADGVRIAKPRYRRVRTHKADPPPLKWSAVMFRKTEDQNGYEETQAGRDCHEAAAG